MLDLDSVFAEMAGFKTEPLNVFEERNQQITDSRDKPLQLIVEWTLPKIVVQVSDQMDEALLLRAREGIVASIKISYGGTFESGKQWL